jgi:hypothetical protein
MFFWPAPDGAGGGHSGFGEMVGQTGTVTTDEPLQCSAKDCRADARWALRWNNPKIHDPDRRKVWLACDEHRDHLSDFLSRRGFLRDTVPVEEAE